MRFGIFVLIVGIKKNGEILKRPTRADCKSADYVFAGSNPALPTSQMADFRWQIL
jgi:hypothetical protein